MGFPSTEYLMSAAFHIAAGVYIAGLVKSLVVFILNNVFVLLAVQFLPKKEEK